MIVVTTPTGNIGSKVVEGLLAAGERVRVVARHPDKLPPAVRAQVDVVQGAIEDEATMQRALEGAESLFLVVPPSFATPDVFAYYRDCTRPSIRACRAHGVQRAVAVSALGARRPNLQAGPVQASLEKDAEFAASGIAFRALWCPGFMENALRDLATLKTQGLFFAPARGDVKMPRAATSDIAASGVRLLRDRSWTGAGGLGVLGPEDLSLDEMAVIMSDVLARPVKFVSVPRQQYEQQLVSYGAHPDFAKALGDMYAAKDDGLDTEEPRTADNTTPTTFRQWCQEVLKPAYDAFTPPAR